MFLKVWFWSLCVQLHFAYAIYALNFYMAFKTAIQIKIMSFEYLQKLVYKQITAHDCTIICQAKYV